MVEPTALSLDSKQIKQVSGRAEEENSRKIILSREGKDIFKYKISKFLKRFLNNIYFCYEKYGLIKVIVQLVI